MEIAAQIKEKEKSIEGLVQLPYLAIAKTLEVIPRTLAQNCGADVMKILANLRNKNENQEDKEKVFYGIDGNKGKMGNMKKLNILNTLVVKKQMLKTNIESACLILRIDDIVSGLKKDENKNLQLFKLKKNLIKNTWRCKRDG